MPAGSTTRLCVARAQRDAALMPRIQRVLQVNPQVYDADKVWRQLNREGLSVARCTVERLMKRLGLEGARRGKAVRTTVPDKALPCPLDRVNRQFRADRPKQLWVSNFTYVSTWQCWLYVAFVIDVFARRIVGWRVSRHMRTGFVLDALEQALYARQSGQANALAETINVLYKTELICKWVLWKSWEVRKLVILEWVTWFNYHRLLESIGYIPQAGDEATYYRQFAEKSNSKVLT
ncbi:transposase [Candidatus Nitrotoga fabula]|uniref:Transposase n=1 Tax=Candidatus Nitrotoga fabula TaxID=2182327 RepID=A0A916BDA5_9PROT|nr:transposase [Candidatus Nitrotoga fabula]